MDQILSKNWTGVGSRETPNDILILMRLLAAKLTDLGWVLRSGGAPGADSAFYDGCKDSPFFYKHTPTIFLAWNGMSNGVEKLYENPTEGLYNAQNFAKIEEARQIALETRGSFEGLKQGGINLHTRNVFQVLGRDIDTPSKFLICWAIPVGKSGGVKGGTNTAVKLAMAKGVEVLNLYTDEGFNRAIRFLNTYKVPHHFTERE